MDPSLQVILPNTDLTQPLLQLHFSVPSAATADNREGRGGGDLPRVIPWDIEQTLLKNMKTKWLQNAKNAENIAHVQNFNLMLQNIRC